MDYICCDHCATEFVLKDSVSTTVRCPDCNQWIELYQESNYATSSFGVSSAYGYDDYDVDNYGYAD
jgi:transcription initiation factor IIE alpha subunit